jgi:predicted Zn-dependent protease
MILLWTTSQAMNNLLHAFAESGHGSTVRSEKLYKGALRFNPFDAATHYDYGTLLYQQNRLVEAIPHIKYAVDHGINTSTAYAYLAAAEEQAKNSSGSEETLAYATRVYPRSVFLLVRYAAALDRIGKNAKSEVVMSSALLIDSRAARGWYQLINFDIDAALAAANQDQGIAMPGELLPQNAVYVVLKENERRLNISPNTGWRGRVRSIDN